MACSVVKADIGSHKGHHYIIFKGIFFIWGGYLTLSPHTSNTHPRAVHSSSPGRRHDANSGKWAVPVLDPVFRFLFVIYQNK